MKLKTRELAIFAMLGAIMYISKIIMEWIPNVHLLGTLTMAYTLVYRRKALSKYLKRSDVERLMETFGYQDMELEAILEKLTVRYQAYVEGRVDFPHEIGLLFGYPPEDVTGFIENNGKNFLCSGYWKVYGDPERAKKTFAGYDRAKEAAIHMAGSGLGVKDIIAFYNIVGRRQLIA